MFLENFMWRTWLCCAIMAKNPHPSPYVRISYVAGQSDEFCEVFPSVAEGTLMHVAPADRILIL